MKDTIYLIAKKGRGIERMRKTAPEESDLYSGEIPVKLNVEIDDGNWEPPFIEKTVEVARWDRGVDVNDVQFEQDFVTPEEAELIKQQRLEKMAERLEDNGYEVNKKQTEEDADNGNVRP